MNALGNGLFHGLLFLEGHVADAPLAQVLADEAAVRRPGTRALPPPPRQAFDLFRAIGLLGGLHSLDTRLSAEEEGFAQRYGNRRAAVRACGTAADAAAPDGQQPAGQERAAGVRRGHGWAATDASTALSSFR